MVWVSRRVLDYFVYLDWAFARGRDGGGRGGCGVGWRGRGLRFLREEVFLRHRRGGTFLVVIFCGVEWWFLLWELY